MLETNYSVLSAVYIKENPEYLKRSIESMVEQTVTTNDYVIVKDGPITPELEVVLSSFVAKYPFIHVCGYEKNKGLGAALNFGLKECKNELVARMDTDDISLPQRCEKELKAFDNKPFLSIVGSEIQFFSNSEDDLGGIKRMPQTSEEIYRYGRRRNPFNHPTVMYKKSVIQRCGGYNETIRGEDFALFTKMLRMGEKGINIPEVLLYYRSNPQQISRRTSWREFKTVLGVVKENYREGYSRAIDLLAVFFLQLAGLLIPKRLVSVFYRKFLLED